MSLSCVRYSLGAILTAFNAIFFFCASRNLMRKEELLEYCSHIIWLVSRAVWKGGTFQLIHWVIRRNTMRDTPFTPRGRIEGRGVSQQACWEQIHHRCRWWWVRHVSVKFMELFLTLSNSLASLEQTPL